VFTHSIHKVHHVEKRSVHPHVSSRLISMVDFAEICFADFMFVGLGTETSATKDLS